MSYNKKPFLFSKTNDTIIRNAQKSHNIFTGLFVPYKQVKVSQTGLLKLKHLYSMCKEVVYKQSIVMNQNDAYFNSIVFPGSRNENNKAQNMSQKHLVFFIFKLTLRTGNINEICK